MNLLQIMVTSLAVYLLLAAMVGDAAREGGGLSWFIGKTVKFRTASGMLYLLAAVMFLAGGSVLTFFWAVIGALTLYAAWRERRTGRNNSGAS